MYAQKQVVDQRHKHDYKVPMDLIYSKAINREYS